MESETPSIGYLDPVAARPELAPRSFVLLCVRWHNATLTPPAPVPVGLSHTPVVLMPVCMGTDSQYPNGAPQKSGMVGAQRYR